MITKRCLGFQQLAAYFKIGTYLQDAEYHPSSKDRYEEGHELIMLNNKFYKGKPVKGVLKLGVNSHHHQLVLLPQEEIESNTIIINDFIIESIYLNGIETSIEGFYHSKLPIVGVQHHIEEAVSWEHKKYAKQIMNYLLSFDRKEKEEPIETQQLLTANL